MGIFEPKRTSDTAYYEKEVVTSIGATSYRVRCPYCTEIIDGYFSSHLVKMNVIIVGRHFMFQKKLILRSISDAI